MKLKYIPGIRPTPMLMYHTKPNKQLFEELINEMNLTNPNCYIDDKKHYWNINAYIILDKNEINSLAFSEFSYVIFLLRVINEEIVINLSDEIFKKIENQLKELTGEIEIINC